jgi:DNA topoisomerase-3
VRFDFDDGPGADDAEPVDFSAQEPLGNCPKCGARVFEHGQAYVCEKATGPARSCDFRSGRLILQRPVEPAQMRKLLATGKTDLLQFVSARTRRPFSAFLVRQPDGKIGFEFEAKTPGKGTRGGRPGGAPLRVLGTHPDDSAPVELHSGRYGPYVKHGAVNATLPDRDKADSLTLDEALAILAEKVERTGGVPAGRRATAKKSPAGAARPRAATGVAEPAAPKAKAPKAAKPAARKAAAKRPAARKTAASASAASTAKSAAKKTASSAKKTAGSATTRSPAVKRKK